ncbi:MAG: LON peptidase substrate-binding domain-containing protein [Pseudoalteromonas sp.]|uniref:LON peptidase substrate-binding domain-containing protein n=1 Tax=unclassified Pseudoalteromonas TaxID=194690 RepID=UPI003F9CF053
MKRAIFPVPVFILPGGYTRLRIFEQRYLSMVKQSLRENTGFVLCAYQHETVQNISNTGCLVNIIDFDLDKNGQLLIDINAESSVAISDVYQDESELRQGRVEYVLLPDWYTKTPISDADKLLSTKLSDMFSSNLELTELYKETQFDNIAWVAARWLEILPISIEKKQQLAFKSNFENLLNFLHTLVNNELTN